MTVLIALGVTCGCNVIQWRQNSMADDLRDQGLVQRTEVVDGATMSFWSGGQGPTIVLLHGFGANALWQWYPQIEALAAGHQLIIPDLLYFGGSYAEDQDFSLERQVRAVTALLAALKVEQADVVGVSYGGIVAYVLAIEQPSLVRRLVIEDSPGPMFTRADYATLCQRFGVEDIDRVFVPETEAGVRTLLELSFTDPPYTPKFAREQFLREHYARFGEERRALLRWVVDNMEAMQARATPVTQPTLILWGEDDPVFPVTTADRLKTYFGGRAILKIIRGTRHMPNMEKPDEVNPILQAFLSGPAC